MRNGNKNCGSRGIELTWVNKNAISSRSYLYSFGVTAIGARQEGIQPENKWLQNPYRNIVGSVQEYTVGSLHATGVASSPQVMTLLV